MGPSQVQVPMGLEPPRADLQFATATTTPPLYAPTARVNICMYARFAAPTTPGSSAPTPGVTEVIPPLPRLQVGVTRQPPSPSHLLNLAVIDAR